MNGIPIPHGKKVQIERGDTIIAGSFVFVAGWCGFISVGKEFLGNRFCVSYSSVPDIKHEPKSAPAPTAAAAVAGSSGTDKRSKNKFLNSRNGAEKVSDEVKSADPTQLREEEV